MEKIGWDILVIQKPWGQGSLERSLIGEGERNMSPIFDICYKEKIIIKYIEITWIENRYI